VTDINNNTKTAVSDRKTYSVSEIIAILGIGKNKAYQLCNSNQFKIIRIGKSIRIVKESFDLWFGGEI
jgi:excisionase family DNA binding protein